MNTNPVTNFDPKARRAEVRGLPGYRRSAIVTATTGTTLVVLWDGYEQGMDTDGGRWQTVCERHGWIISHETLATAQGWLPHADDWCEACADPAEDARMTEVYE